MLNPYEDEIQAFRICIMDNNTDLFHKLWNFCSEYLTVHHLKAIWEILVAHGKYEFMVNMTYNSNVTFLYSTGARVDVDSLRTTINKVNSRKNG